jgi:hypothetical protein
MLGSAEKISDYVTQFLSPSSAGLSGMLETRSHYVAMRLWYASDLAYHVLSYERFDKTRTPDHTLEAKHGAPPAGMTSDALHSIPPCIILELTALLCPVSLNN